MAKPDIKNFFNVGSTYNYGNLSFYRINSIKDMKVLINHLDNYPLVTDKLSDYILFKEAFYKIKNKEHLTEEGLKKIKQIQDKMNLYETIKKEED